MQSKFTCAACFIASLRERGFHVSDPYIYRGDMSGYYGASAVTASLMSRDHGKKYETALVIFVGPSFCAALYEPALRHMEMLLDRYNREGPSSEKVDT